MRTHVPARETRNLSRRRLKLSIEPLPIPQPWLSGLHLETGLAKSIVSTTELGEGIRCRCIILHPKKPSAARREKGKIDILHGLWNLRHREESSKRSPLIRSIRPSQER